ncbi:Mlf1IP domain-containing protein [Cephalotus follicularis]|uniref:Mlf1IP domain-containing protein n=1 Tax=Cephalotus follicularis TaxID=3775 RepID=A0A1Q3CRG9_CEPFO|nr:Mlf1IP domain-containing protein [Cephalotus follicularis]
MQGGRGHGDPSSNFPNPFAGFGGFGGFGGPRSMMSGFFGGRDPFDDPFFTRPFGGVFESSFFGPRGNPFADMHHPGFLEHHPPEPQNSRGPIIEELDDNDEKEQAVNGKKENPRKHGRSNSDSYVEHPDDAVVERNNKQLQYRNSHDRVNIMQPPHQGHSFTFQSSTVTYGGANGNYYTSSKTRRTGSDGITFEESKEADAAARQATHKISRGLHDKGHSVERKLKSDGKVETMQTLHNLNEDELTGFEDTWNGKARKHLPGWTGRFIGHENMGDSSGGPIGQATQKGWALP